MMMMMMMSFTGQLSPLSFSLFLFVFVGGIDGAKDGSKPKSKDRQKYEKQCYAKDADEEENIIFEDFAKLRMSMSEIDN